MLPSLWRISGQTYLFLPDDDRLVRLRPAVRICDALCAYDQSDLAGVIELQASSAAKSLNMASLMALRANWEAPLSAYMMGAGKGVDTHDSTKDRNLEFQQGGIAKSSHESPYDYIFNGGLNPALLRSPELFLKVWGALVTGPGGKIGRRRLAKIVKPEAEFTVVLAPRTLRRVGWTIGNDMTINLGGNDGTNVVPGETECSLLLPQTKTFDRCCGIGPCIILSKDDPAPDTSLTIHIIRGNISICTQTMYFRDYIRDTEAVLAGWLRPAWQTLYQHEGGFLMLGTGTRIPNEASVLPGDIITMESPMFPAEFTQEVVEVN